MRNGMMVSLAVVLAAVGPCAVMSASGDEANRAHRLPAWRNERVHAHYAVSGGQTGAQPTFTVTDFQGEQGAKISAARARVRFGEDVLAEKPAAARTADESRSVWLTVDVPKDAAPGAYTGTLVAAGADGGKLTFTLTLDVRHEVLPDPQDWMFFRELERQPAFAAYAGTAASDAKARDALRERLFGQLANGRRKSGSLAEARLLGTIAHTRGIDALLRRMEFVWPKGEQATARTKGAFLSDCGACTSIGWEAFRDGIETYEKIRALTDSGLATWHLPAALKRLDDKALAETNSAAYATCVKTVEEAIDELSTPGRVNGRAVERFDETYGAEVGYQTPVKEVYLVQHPTPANDRPGRPLYVVFHSSGHNCVNALLCTRAPNNHDIYHAPDDFYALYLDCKMAAGTDWWWGYDKCHGFALSPCERRCLATIEKVVRTYGIDRERIYLCGNSMGGSGCLGFALRHGDVFAAAKANVPALVEHACDRMGWDMKTERDVAGVDFARLPDPPLLIDHSAPNDMHWSTGHEHLFAMMNARRYPWISYWADHKHCNRNCLILEKNDVYLSFDWTKIRKSDILPAFTRAATDTPYPWPDHRDAPGAGQINAFFQWRDGRDAANEVSITLVVADLASKHFTIPATIAADVTLRRLRALKVRPGDVFDWTFGAARGTVTVGADGLLTVPSLPISKTAQTLRLVRR